MAHAAGFDPGSIAALYRGQPGPSQRKDLIRALLLVQQGGVYMDLDTVTVRSLRSLRESAGAFCGEERICFPGWSAGRKELRTQTRAYALTAVRYCLRLAPRGFEAFRLVEPLYALQVNGAVLGAEPESNFVRAYIRAMLALPTERAHSKSGIGPDLLAETVAGYQGGELRVLPPRWFYPLAPEISEHWWSRVRAPAEKLDRVLGEEAHVVHWYGSVRNAKLATRVDPGYVRTHASRQLFSALAARFLSDFN
jgi:hypothetical protein